ncbi:hypothetical protein [Pseudomonas sp.]|uniref:hypothetical protein n=1 Tax=Pseudomonas sp. TaxID=306 RepID=UPI002609EC3F|nr:hypothetical protein [Pseudomonas sp.]
MAVCAKVVTLPQGSVFAVDTTQTDLTACAYVVESGPDLSNSFLLMSAEDGGYFAAGLITVWMAAWGVKAVINVVQGSISNE